MHRHQRMLYTRLAPILCALCLFVPGLFGIVLTDVGHAPDVWTHVYRISGIVNGDIVARPVSSTSRYHSVAEENVGGAVNRDIMELSIERYNDHDPGSVLPESISGQQGETIDVPYNNTAAYSPLAYVPQLAAFAAGKAMGIGALATYYLAEVTMLVVWTALGTLALMALPRFRAPMLVLMLFPAMWLPYSYAISADSLALILCVLYACLVFRGIDQPDAKTFAAMGVVGLLLAVGKFSNAPLFAIALAVPLVSGRTVRRGSDQATGPAEQLGGNPRSQRTHSLRGGSAWIYACFALAVIVDIIWLKLGTSHFTTSPSMVSQAVAAQRSASLLGNPLEPFAHIVYSIMHVEGAYLFGREGVAIFWFGLAAGILLTLVVFLQTRSRRALFWLWVCLVVMVAALIAYLALWLQYTPDGVPGVMGVQYRYFLPYLPFAVLLFADDCQGTHLFASSKQAA